MLVLGRADSRNRPGGIVERSTLRAAARVFSRFLQRALVERLVVGVLAGVSALCRFGRLGLGWRGLLGHAPSISAPREASSCHVRGAFRHEPGHPCEWPGSTFWSGRRDSNTRGRCPRAPEARASTNSATPRWHLAEESNPGKRFWRPPHCHRASHVCII